MLMNLTSGMRGGNIEGREYYLIKAFFKVSKTSGLMSLTEQV